MPGSKATARKSGARSKRQIGDREPRTELTGKAGLGQAEASRTHMGYSESNNDPTNQRWVRTGGLNVARFFIPPRCCQRKVLAVGGGNETGILASAELFDPNASQ